MIPSASASSDPLLAGLPVPASAAAAATTTAAGEAPATDFSQVLGQLAPAMPLVGAMLPLEGAAAPTAAQLGFPLVADDVDVCAEAGEPVRPAGEGEGPAAGGPAPGLGGLLTSPGVVVARPSSDAPIATPLPESRAARSTCARGPVVHAKAINRAEPELTAAGPGGAEGITARHGSDGAPAASDGGPVGAGGRSGEKARPTATAATRVADFLHGVDTGSGPLVVPFLPTPPADGSDVGAATVTVVATATASAAAPEVASMPRPAAASGAPAMSNGAAGFYASSVQAVPFDADSTAAPAGQLSSSGERVSMAAPMPGESVPGAYRRAEVARRWAAALPQSSFSPGVPVSNLSPTVVPAAQPGLSSSLPGPALVPALPRSGGGAGEPAIGTAMESATEFATEVGVFSGAMAPGAMRPTDRGENFAPRRMALPGAGEMSIGSGLKTTEESVRKQDERQISVAGIDVANREPAMPFPPPELVVPTVFSAAALRGTGETGGLEEPKHPEMGTQAARAVEAVCTAAELAQRDGRGSLTLRFAMGEADLAVRVEVREQEVRATFSTESAELRQALSHECAAAAESSGRSFRLTAQITDQGGAASGGTAFSSDSGFARREPHHPPQNPELARLATPARGAHDEPRATPTASLATGYSGQSQHLHTLA